MWVLVIFVGGSFAVLGCVIWCACKRKSNAGQTSAPYTVAMQNRLFNVKKTFKSIRFLYMILLFEFQDENMATRLPCQNCHLIEMGSMACYQGKCPECGRLPPGAKKIQD